MSTPPSRSEIAQLRAELAAQRAEIAQLQESQRQPHSRPMSKSIRSLAAAGVLLALIPLGILAAAPTFRDIDDAAPVHRANIQAIGNAGITSGFEDPANPGQRIYNPKGLVTREEMASFLARTAGIGGNPPVVNAQTAVLSQSAANSTNAQNADHAASADTATTAQTATNAAQLNGQPASYYQLAGQPVANATNAQTAQTANSAQFAQNAAQLNGQPASYYQAAGQPVAYATTAQQAQTATTAQTAQSANTLNGFSASQLLGVARASVAQITLGSTDTDVVTLTITAPASGYVSLNAAATAYTTATTGCPCRINLRFFDVTRGTAGSNWVTMETLANAATNDASYAALSNLQTYPVPAAGTYAYKARLARVTGTALVYGDVTLTATFIPFYIGDPITAP